MDTQTTGPVLVVGTAYNIDGQEDPYNNNGGEVAVMLEVARLFMNSTNGKPRFPIIFVAFDLGSEKCWGPSFPEEVSHLPSCTLSDPLPAAPALRQCQLGLVQLP
ncbi:hypothetical protein Pcinc_001406 [Petrolisthes cinctipes]|uniref:Uncharacterized protein n=1 Tax=Petrolisthes cinctipes TaxID=88211 RepID=A0AAE1L3A5_PETCI|nr:hypothetical protein Pcinc_001406 [Petrolisthes cinctipes]